MSQPTPEAILNEFLRNYAEDRSRGACFDLDHYLDRFPGHADVIAREFISLTDESVLDGDATERIGDYELVRELGRGGQGVVYAAHDTRLNRPVALKVLQAGAGLSGASLERFRREAEVTARLDHPNICTVHETGTHGGRAYIAMRLIDGEPLDRWRREESRSRPAEIDVIVGLVRKVALALHSAHEAGIVHRDVKPSNIMITAAGSMGSASGGSRDVEPVITDFGLAAIEDESLPTLTQSGDLLGTPAYMSPEQIVRQQTGIDRRTDVYSLGVTLYECLTSTRPFSAPTREGIYRAILHEPPPMPSRLNSAISRDLETVVMTAMEKDRQRRYQTALDLAEDLERVAAGEPIAARPIGTAVKLARWRKRNPTVAALLFAATVVTVAAFIHVTSSNRTLEREQRRTTAALTAFQRLADTRRLADLRQRAEALWPAAPEIADDLEAWLADAASLEQRLPTHARDLEDVRRIAEVDDSVEVAWRREILADLVTGLEALSVPDSGLIDGVRRRLELATTIERRSISDHAEAWDEAIAAVKASPGYRGLALIPQLGLIPLRADPESGLQEFLHLTTHAGPIPVRQADGRLHVTTETGVVLVLLPGGVAVIGTDGVDEDGLQPDPTAAVNELPAHEVELEPFLVSKYELTQAQWRRFTGSSPSWYGAGKSFDGMTITEKHPVTNVDWNTASRELGRMGLALPTESQWEYACRAGSDTPFYFGDTANMARHCNLADVAYRRTYVGGEYEERHDDGWSAHAPIGTYLPNGFGLHEIAGNVFEWCRDGISDYAKVAARPGDGYREGLPSRVLRGGSFKKVERWMRSSARAFNVKTVATAEIGLRPVRSLER